MCDGGKKLLNDVDRCVDECLAGLAAAHPSLLTLYPQHRVIVAKCPAGGRKVGLVSGGGSGHEPFPAGFVGSGMLTGAVCGSVFASPPSSNIVFAIRAVARASPGGVLVLVPNYTGDILNFGLAVELAKSEGYNVESLVVGDDIAQSGTVGRRAMVGLVAAFKAAGSAAQRGASLPAVRDAAALIAADTASLGLALGGGTLPGASAPLFSLAKDEMELGVGVHGEAGIRRLKLVSAADATALCLDHLVPFLALDSGSKVVVMVNNLGGLSQLEQWVVVGEVHRQLAVRGVAVMRTYAAPLFTSINMPGVQICLIRLSPEGESAYTAALDDDTNAPAWPGNVPSINNESPTLALACETDPEPVLRDRGPCASPQTALFIRSALVFATDALRSNEETLNLLDSGCGDGDCGTTLRHLADGIDARIARGDLKFEFPATAAAQLAAVAASTMGGTSGAIYSLMLTHAGDALADSSDLTEPATWAAVWRAAIRGVQKYSRARVGDRTMFDALEPALEVFSECLASGQSAETALRSAVTAAQEGCERTKTMTARAGRASYVEAARVMDADAGAFAVTVWLRALLRLF